MQIKVIITGATGMVGEGVLLECLQNPNVKEVLIINRRPYPLQHPKLKELIAPDFFKLNEFTDQLKGYDACYYCAGVSSVGMKEKEYSYITYDTTIAFAKVIQQLNPASTFCFVSGSHTDSSEKGKVMWARVKGKTENALTRMGFAKTFNFRPGLMKPTEGQKNIKTLFKIISGMYGFFKLIMPNQVSTLSEVGQAMINGTLKGYPTTILEVPDIKALAKM